MWLHKWIKYAIHKSRDDSVEVLFSAAVDAVIVENDKNNPETIKKIMIEISSMFARKMYENRRKS